MFLTNIGNFIMIIIWTHNCWSWHSVDKERFFSVLFIFCDHLIKGIIIHLTSPSIAWDLSCIIHTHTRYHNTSIQRIMRLSWCIDNGFIFISPSFKSDVREVFLSSSKNCHDVSHCSAWIHSSVDSFGVVSKVFTVFLDQFNFHNRHDGSDVINVDGGI